MANSMVGFAPLLVYLPLVFATWLLVRWTRNYYKLAQIPGPFVAKFSDVWRVWHACTGQTTKESKLHDKYGPLLRMGPNHVAVSDARSLSAIYGLKPVFNKGPLYVSHQFVSADGVVMQNVSSTRDEKEHARLRRPVNHAYALTTLLGYEKLMDVTTSAFFRQLEERFVATGVECDLANWLQFYAFDVIGEMTFGTRFGFCEQGQDVGDMLKHTMAHMKWMSSMGQLPWLDNKIRLQNWFARKFRKTNEIVRFAAYHIDLHLKQEKTGSEEWGDFISRCQSAVQKYPSIMTPDQIVDYATTNVSAGSDTTAIILREVIYRLHVDKQGRLERILNETKEILKARLLRGEDLSGHISWKESSSMPFLDACIKETMRIHPALGHVLPRVVPAGGVTLCGKFLPEGTEVGCNAWTVHRDKSVFGEDVDVWRPERYLEGDPEAIKLMERSSFVFGGGSRTCIGRHIATLELMKLVPEFLRVFEIDLVDPKRYKDNYSWIVMQSGLDVKLKLRDQKSWLGVYS